MHIIQIYLSRTKYDVQYIWDNGSPLTSYINWSIYVFMKKVLPNIDQQLKFFEPQT